MATDVDTGVWKITTRGDLTKSLLPITTGDNFRIDGETHVVSSRFPHPHLQTISLHEKHYWYHDFEKEIFKQRGIAKRTKRSRLSPDQSTSESFYQRYLIPGGENEDK